jgi:hypothetical protein
MPYSMMIDNGLKTNFLYLANGFHGVASSFPVIKFVDQEYTHIFSDEEDLVLAVKQFYNKYRIDGTNAGKLYDVKVYRGTLMATDNHHQNIKLTDELKELFPELF